MYFVFREEENTETQHLLCIPSVMTVSGCPGSVQYEQRSFALFLKAVGLFWFFIEISSGGFQAASVGDGDFYPRHAEREQLQCDLCSALLAGSSAFLGAAEI